MGKKTLLLDFDGVIHSYTSGWCGHLEIPDPPVPGAFNFIEEAVNHFELCIYSSRSKEDGGIAMMRRWFKHHGLPEDVLDRLSFPRQKPAAWLTIDDRAMCFNGEWPLMSEIEHFHPWYKKPEQRGTVVVEPCKQPRIGDVNRGTGTTERMLQQVAQAVKDGQYVFLVCAEGAREDARQRLLEMLPDPQPAGTKLYSGTGSVTIETPATVRMDWGTGTVRHAHPSCRVFVDHYALEREFGWVIQEWIRSRLGLDLGQCRGRSFELVINSAK